MQVLKVITTALFFVGTAVSNDLLHGFENFKLPDPLLLKNTTMTFSDTSRIKGTYTLSNGIITGLSSLAIIRTFEYGSSFLTANFNLTLDRFEFTGLYEVADGQVGGALDKPQEEEMPVYDFSGQGSLNVTLTKLVTDVGLSVKYDLDKKIVVVDSLKDYISVESVFVYLQKFKLNGMEVDWQMMNILIKPTFDVLIEDFQEDLEEIRFKLNEKLKSSPVSTIAGAIYNMIN